MFTLLVIVLLIVLLVPAAPQCGFHNAGYTPLGVVLMVLLIVVILRVLGVV